MKFRMVVARWVDEFKTFSNQGKNKKYIVAILALSILLATFEAGRGIGEGNAYIVDKASRVRGIVRDSEAEVASFPLQLEVDEGKGRRTKKNVSLEFYPKEEENSTNLFEGRQDVNDMIQDLVSDIENKGGKRIRLPDKLDNGSSLTWKKRREGNFILIILIAPVLIGMMFVDAKKKKRDRQKARETDVFRCLPRFNDQLILLLDCGLIFNDAYLRIVDGYRQCGEVGFFRDWMAQVVERSKGGNTALVTVFSDMAKDSGIRELTRVAGIIEDNQEMGDDLVDKLEVESVMLWNKRKNVAEERGHIAETRLTFPLAILLMVLLLITAGPAMLKM